MADIKILDILDKLNNPMTHASLFSGIGGPEVAAAMLGWENVFHCEINDFGRAILEYHFPKSKSYIDVTKTDFTEWRGRVDVLTGGFPCQPFSYAGRRGGVEDDRYLWPQFERVIAEVQPAWVVGENVAGITTMVEPGEVTLLGSEASLFSEDDAVYRYLYDQPFTVERVCSDLEQLGYAVQPMLIPACAVGAPHRRDRVFFLAYSEDAMHLRCSEREDEERINPREHWNTGTGGTERHGCEERAITSDGYRSLQKEYRWRNFPTVSPVHRGNDGIPFPLDCLTISPNKWRTDSLKAYGNAIVPQVMYEIFRAIELTH